MASIEDFNRVNLPRSLKESILTDMDTLSPSSSMSSLHHEPTPNPSARQPATAHHQQNMAPIAAVNQSSYADELKQQQHQNNRDASTTPTPATVSSSTARPLARPRNHPLCSHDSSMGYKISLVDRADNLLQGLDDFEHEEDEEDQRHHDQTQKQVDYDDHDNGGVGDLNPQQKPSLDASRRASHLGKVRERMKRALSKNQ